MIRELFKLNTEVVLKDRQMLNQGLLHPVSDSKCNAMPFFHTCSTSYFDFLTLSACFSCESATLYVSSHNPFG